MKRKKEDYFVIGLGVILVIIIFVIAIITTNSSRQNNGTVVVISPSPQIATPTPMPANSKPPVFYNNDDQEKLIDYVRNRRPISDTDRLAKAKILANLPSGEKSGIVYRTNNFVVDYTNSADVFQIEIMTTDVQRAKNEVNVWLRTQGMSQDAICQFPIVFYLNYDVANQLRESGYVFSPLGNAC